MENNSSFITHISSFAAGVLVMENNRQKETPVPIYRKRQRKGYQGQRRKSIISEEVLQV